MTVACAYLELNRFTEAAGFLKLTFDVCSKQKNYGLLVQTFVACSGMFFSLKSYPEAKEFATRAVELAGTIFNISPGSCRYRRCEVHLIPVQVLISSSPISTIIESGCVIYRFYLLCRSNYGN